MLISLGSQSQFGDRFFRTAVGHRDNWPMSNTAMLSVLIRLGVKVTVHGFRSTFRDWAGDKTHFPRDVIEMALAHAVGDDLGLSRQRLPGELALKTAARCRQHHPNGNDPNRDALNRGPGRWLVKAIFWHQITSPSAVAIPQQFAGNRRKAIALLLAGEEAPPH
jgi:hypothetical protein